MPYKQVEQNSADSDQTAPKEQSDLDLHCFEYALFSQCLGRLRLKIRKPYAIIAGPSLILCVHCDSIYKYLCLEDIINGPFTFSCRVIGTFNYSCRVIGLLSSGTDTIQSRIPPKTSVVVISCRHKRF